ncbi:MAG: hypothetical protein U0T74_02855 [Chitinophagales bacterium]
MKRFTLLLLLASMTLVNGQTIHRQLLRELFLQATERRSALDSLAGKLESLPRKSPAEESYLGICNGLYCQYDDGNWAKLKHVMKSKNHLNSAVERDSRDPELRFLRLMLEHFLPSFLGLNKHITEDLNTIFSNPGFIDDNLPLKKKVMEFLLWSKRCTPEQNKLLEQQLAELNKKLNPTVAKKNG